MPYHIRVQTQSAPLPGQLLLRLFKGGIPYPQAHLVAVPSQLVLKELSVALSHVLHTLILPKVGEASTGIGGVEPLAGLAQELLGTDLDRRGRLVLDLQASNGDWTGKQANKHTRAWRGGSSSISQLSPRLRPRQQR